MLHWTVVKRKKGHSTHIALGLMVLNYVAQTLQNCSHICIESSKNILQDPTASFGNFEESESHIF